MRDFQSLSRRPLVGLIAPLVFLSEACRAQLSSSVVTVVPSYSTLSAADVREVHPRLVRSIVLGDRQDNRPSFASDVLIVSRRVFVLDGTQRALLVYDDDGKHLRRAAEWGDRDGALESPVRLVANYDSVLVLDVTHRNAVSAFDREGRFMGARFPDLHNASAVSMAVGRITAAFSQLDAKRRPGRTVVSIRDYRGTEIGAGCAAADAYELSERRHGMLAHFASSSVAMRGNRIYCAQAITPVVTVLDLSGKTVGYLTVAPPFYVTPSADIGETQNQKTLLEFQSKWTSLQSFSVTPTGFVSIYSRYDVAAGDFIYRMFACDLDVRPKNCRVALIPGRPVRFVSPDTLLSVTSSRNGDLALQIFRLDRE